MEIKTEIYRSKGRKINLTDNMMRITIDLPRIEGIKLKKELEERANNK